MTRKVLNFLRTRAIIRAILCVLVIQRTEQGKRVGRQGGSLDEADRVPCLSE
jgi:hypothetical protein